MGQSERRRAGGRPCGARRRVAELFTVCCDRQKSPRSCRRWRQRSGALRPKVWRMLLDETAHDDARLNLACLAAEISAADPQWAKIAPAVASALVAQHPLDMGTFTAALWPARQRLTPSFMSLYRDPDVGTSCQTSECWNSSAVCGR